MKALVAPAAPHEIVARPSETPRSPGVIVVLEKRALKCSWIVVAVLSALLLIAHSITNGPGA